MLVASGLDDALNQVYKSDMIESVFIIGGGSIYQQAIDQCGRIFLTEIESPTFECDTFCPLDLTQYNCVSNTDPMTANGATFRFQVWEKKQTEPERSPVVTGDHEELQYLRLVEQILTPTTLQLLLVCAERNQRDIK